MFTLRQKKRLDKSYITLFKFISFTTFRYTGNSTIFPIAECKYVPQQIYRLVERITIFNFDIMANINPLNFSTKSRIYYRMHATTTNTNYQ